MELNEYQDKAMTTCTDSSNNFAYMMLNLVGEVGEFTGKIAKSIRTERCMVDGNDLLTTIGNEELEEAAMKEAGDILWQLSGLCGVLGWSLEEVAKVNLEKLASRKQRGVIVGEGDNR